MNTPSVLFLTSVAFALSCASTLAEDIRDIPSRAYREQIERHTAIVQGPSLLRVAPAFLPLDLFPARPTTSPDPAARFAQPIRMSLGGPLLPAKP
jgi:hypothetical protein